VRSLVFQLFFKALPLVIFVLEWSLHVSLSAFLVSGSGLEENHMHFVFLFDL
jgi:hypothetical protein